MSKDLNTTKAHVGLSGKVFKKIIAGSDGRVLWQAGAVVSYIVDTGVSYTEEVSSGESCLSPKTFTPSKSGWTFAGWREDGQANGSVLSSKVMGSDPIVLYAVYKKTCSAKFISYNSTQTATGTAYYNASGHVGNYSVVAPDGAAYSGWTWRGWSGWHDNVADASVAYANGATIVNLNPDNDGLPFYGLYQLTHTVDFVDWNGSEATHQYAYPTSYYNAAGNTKHSKATAHPGGAFSGYNFCGWSRENSEAIEAVLGNGDPFEVSYSHTRYAVYVKTIAISFNGNGATGGSVAPQTGDQYCNVAGTWQHPLFTLPANGFYKTDYAFVKWALYSAGGTQYDPGSSIELTGDATLYAVWEQTVLQLYPNGLLTTWEGGNPSNGIYAQSEVCDGDLAEGSAHMYSTNAVNASGFNKIKLTYRLWAYLEYNSYVDAYIRVGSSPNAYDYANIQVTAVHEDSSAKTLEIDVSGISGNVYFTFAVWAGCRSTGNYQQGTLYIDDLEMGK